MHESASAAYKNPSVPAWKAPEKFGDEEMFDEDDVELDKAHSTFEGRDALKANAGITTSEPEPEVQKIKRDGKTVKKAKTTAPVATNTVSGGKAVRRIKNVGTGKVTTTQAAAPARPKPAPEAAPLPKTDKKKAAAPAPVRKGEPIPNPLPLPAKKAHKPMDYDEKIKKNADDDWDFDYDIDDNDDWDV
jgi:hypothetical protein